jgi:hypothetical protein
MQLRFVTSESAFDYFRTTRAYLEAHGKPVAFYSDKHGIFRVNSKEAAADDGVTQFGRALLALNIDIICANSPQAKGRIERAFLFGARAGTLMVFVAQASPPRPGGRFGFARLERTGRITASGSSSLQSIRIVQWKRRPTSKVDSRTVLRAKRGATGSNTWLCG